MRFFPDLLGHKIPSLHRQSWNWFAHQGTWLLSAEQSVCCWDIHHADKPEANTAIIRHLVCCGKQERLLCPLWLRVEPLFSPLSPAPLSQTPAQVPNQQTSVNVPRAVKTSPWWTISLGRTCLKAQLLQNLHSKLSSRLTLCSRQVSSRLRVNRTTAAAPCPGCHVCCYLALASCAERKPFQTAVSLLLF